MTDPEFEYEYNETLKSLKLYPEEYEAWRQYGRIRRIAKEVDPYSMTFERDNKLYVAISSGHVIKADKFKMQSDDAVRDWLKLMLDIGLAFKGGETHAKVF